MELLNDPDRRGPADCFRTLLELTFGVRGGTFAYEILLLSMAVYATFVLVQNELFFYLIAMKWCILSCRSYTRVFQISWKGKSRKITEMEIWLFSGKSRKNTQITEILEVKRANFHRIRSKWRDSFEDFRESQENLTPWYPFWKEKIKNWNGMLGVLKMISTIFWSKIS